MDSFTIDKMKHRMNTDVVRRLLIQYFKLKGFTESFDRLVYPAMLQDLAQAIPVLCTKVEVEPHALEVDPSTGKAVLGWNLFVLGNHRMYLGETYHRDLMDLARQIQSGQIVIPEGHAAARRQSTPRQIVNFVVRVLGRHDAGYVDLVPPRLPAVGTNPLLTGSNALSSGQFYQRSGYGT